MASCKSTKRKGELTPAIVLIELAKLAKTGSDSNADPNQQSREPRLPQTLVRIPTEHAPTLQAQTESLEAAAAEEEATEST